MNGLLKIRPRNILKTWAITCADSAKNTHFQKRLKQNVLPGYKCGYLDTILMINQ